MWFSASVMKMNSKDSFPHFDSQRTDYVALIMMAFLYFPEHMHMAGGANYGFIEHERSDMQNEKERARGKEREINNSR